MIDLTNVKASSGRLPVGGYVCTIKSAQDIPHEEYVEIVYDIAEGEYKDFYKDEEDWLHTTRRYYKGNAGGVFKGFLETLAKDNPNADIESVVEGKSTKGLIGCKFGALIQERYYTGKDGSDKTALDVAAVILCERIRTGNYTMPEPRDTRTREHTNSVDGDIMIGDAPF